MMISLNLCRCFHLILATLAYKAWSKMQTIFCGWRDCMIVSDLFRTSYTVDVWVAGAFTWDKYPILPWNTRWIIIRQISGFLISTRSLPNFGSNLVQFEFRVQFNEAWLHIFLYRRDLRKYSATVQEWPRKCHFSLNCNSNIRPQYSWKWEPALRDSHLMVTNVHTFYFLSLCLLNEWMKFRLWDFIEKNISSKTSKWYNFMIDKFL